METGKLSAADRIAAANKKREAQSKAEAKEKEEQEATDLEAISELEYEHGFDRIIRIKLSTWKPGIGAPTSIAVRVPLGSEMNCTKFIHRINKSKEGSPEKISAQVDLAKECWVYPPMGSDAQKAAAEIAPLIYSNAAYQIIRAAQGQEESEGKG